MCSLCRSPIFVMHLYQTFLHYTNQLPCQGAVFYSESSPNYRGELKIENHLHIVLANMYVDGPILLDAYMCHRRGRTCVRHDVSR